MPLMAMIVAIYSGDKIRLLLFFHLLFLRNVLFIIGVGTLTPNDIMSDYKRVYRELDDDVKDKISRSSRNKPKSEEHKMHISQSMTDYWKTVPHKPNPDDNKSV